MTIPHNNHKLFVSYNQSDSAWVKGYLLPALGLDPSRLIVAENFRPGASIINEFERAVKESHATLVVMSPGYFSDEWSVFAEQLTSFASIADQSDRVIPLLLKPLDVPLRLAFRVQLDFTSEANWENEVSRLRIYLAQPTPTREYIPCPFPGMVPFTEQDTARFYGRKAETEKIVQHFRYHRFLIILGASGSGKSSLTFAGVLPKLQESTLFPPGYWLVRNMRPGEAPLQALKQIFGNDLSDLSKATRVLLDQQAGAQRLLLVIDQFEELFTQVNREEQNEFSSMLKTLRSVPDCALLLTMRAAFYQDLMNSDLWPIDQSERLEIVPLRGRELGLAIEKPAAEAGVYLETGLLDNILRDAANEPGVLPLVQETMVLLWNKMVHRLVPLRAYKELGKSGLAVAMANKADATLLALPEPQRLIARRIFLRLIQFGEGRPDTRRQQPRSKLRSVTDISATFENTLEQLVDSRLLTFSGDEGGKNTLVDIAHESLIEVWPTLQLWIKDRREAEQLRRRLEGKAAEWVRLGAKSGGLLDEIELNEAQNWLTGLDATELGYSPELKLLVDQSEAAIQKALAEKEAARERELRFEKQRAEEAAEAARKIHKRAIGLGIALVAAVAAMVFAFHQLNVAQSRQLAGQALSYIYIRMDRALPVSIRGYLKDRNEESTGSLLAVVQESRSISRFVEGHTGFAWSVHFSPDGKFIVSGNSDGTVTVWDVQSPGKPLRTLMGHQKTVNIVKFNHQGTLLASAGDDGTIRLWDVGTFAQHGEPLVGDKENQLTSLDFTPDDKTLVSAGTNKTIILWDLQSRSSKVIPAQHKKTIYSLAYSPDGKILASGSDDTTIIFWNAVTFERTALLNDHYGSVFALAFSPDGRTLVSGSGGDSDRNLIAWDVAQHKMLGDALLAHTGAVFNITFTKDGDKFITASADKSIRIWDANTFAEKSRSKLMAHRAQVNSIDISNDGSKLVSASWDGTIIMWDLSTPNVLAQKLYDQVASIQKVSFGPNNRSLMSIDSEGNASFKDADKEPRSVNIGSGYHSTVPYGIAFSPDGAVLATGNKDNSVVLWDTHTHQPIGLPLRGHKQSVTDVAFSDDGDTLASASNDGTIILWSRSRHQQIGVPLKGHSGPVNSLAFSRNNKVLAAGYKRFALILWDVATQQQLGNRMWTGVEINSVAISPDGNSVAAGTQDSTVVVFKLNEPDTAGEILKINESDDSVTSVAYSPDGKLLAGGLEDGSIMIWNAASLTALGPPRKISDTYINSIAFSRDSKIIAIGNDSKQVLLWDTASAKVSENNILKEHTGFVLCVAFSPDGKTLAAGSGDESVIFWDVATHQQLTPALKGTDESVKSVALSQDGKYLAVGTNGGFITIWDVETKQTFRQPFKANEKAINDLAFSPDGKLLAAANADNTIRFWSVDSGQLVGSDLVGHTREARALAFSPDGQILASGGLEGTVILWDVNSHQAVGQPLKRHTKSIYRVTFSPDGTLLASAGQDRIIVLWDIRKHQQSGSEMLAHENNVWSIVFSPDGRMIASGGDDGNINLWDVKTHDRIGLSFTAPGQVWSLAFSDDGKKLLSGGDDKGVTSWNLDPESWLSLAQRISGGSP